MNDVADGVCGDDLSRFDAVKPLVMIDVTDVAVLSCRRVIAV